MTEIIPGLQGELPPSSRKGVPFVNGRQVIKMTRYLVYSCFLQILFCFLSIILLLLPCSHRVAACAKHYVGDGGTRNGINENNTIISRHDLLKIHMAPYYQAIEKGVATVMVSYSSWNGKKMHSNRDLVTGYLKNRLKFRVR